MAVKRDPAVEEEFMKAMFKGSELLSTGQLQEALPFLEKAHSLNQRNEKAQNLLGLCNFKLGNFERAAQVYELLVRDNPVDATLRVNLGLVYLKTNQLELCIKEFETATDLDSDHKKAHNYLGLALAQKGDYLVAKEHFIIAGSAPMVEKMEKALRNQQFNAPASIQESAGKVPVTPTSEAPLQSEQARSSNSAPPNLVVSSTSGLRSSNSGIQSVHEMAPRSDAKIQPLSGDWSSQIESPPAPPQDDIRFAEDEGPPALSTQVPAETSEFEDLPVIDGMAVEVDVSIDDAAGSLELPPQVPEIVDLPPAPEPEVASAPEELFHPVASDEHTLVAPPETQRSSA